jgi:hypothetical protein
MLDSLAHSHRRSAQCGCLDVGLGAFYTRAPLCATSVAARVAFDIRFPSDVPAAASGAQETEQSASGHALVG